MTTATTTKNDNDKKKIVDDAENHNNNIAGILTTPVGVQTKKKKKKKWISIYKTIYIKLFIIIILYTTRVFIQLSSFTQFLLLDNDIIINIIDNNID